MAPAAGALSTMLTVWTAETLASLVPPTSLPLTLNGRADRSKIAAAFLISLLTSLIFGILPALRTSRLAPVEVLKEAVVNQAFADRT